MPHMPAIIKIILFHVFLLQKKNKKILLRKTHLVAIFRIRIPTKWKFSLVLIVVQF